MKKTNTFFLLGIFLFLSLLTNVFALTEEELNKLPPEEARKIPILKALPALGMSQKTFLFMIEDCLIDLRYLFKKPSGQLSDELISAIKQFQSDIGQKPTGIMLMGEWEELTKRHGLIGFVPIYPGGFHVIGVADLVSAEGTWVFEKEDNADPIQKTKIICHKPSGRCWMATARVSMPGKSIFGMDMASLYVDIEEWPITKWSSYEVQAENDDSQCVSYTLTINIKNKEAHMFRRGKGNKDCEGIAESPSILKLVDGFDVGYKYYQDRNNKISDIRSSAFQKLVKELLSNKK